MNDPHVESLRYRFVSEQPSDKYDEAAPLSTSLGPFDVELRDGTLMVYPHDHYADPDEAKDAFEPYLRSWETSAVLHEGHYRIRFRYVTADVIDRDPPPTNGKTVRLRGVIDGVSTTDKASLTRSMAEYPNPDPSFRASPLTDDLVFRLEQVYDGREPLPAMAYWMLNRLETEYGRGGGNKREEAAERLEVDVKVLDKIGELTSNVADPRLGRKADGSEKRSYTPDELQWLREVVVRLIRRIGELHAGETKLEEITLGDFPPI